MKLQADGVEVVRLAPEPRAIRSVLADAEQLLAILGDLVHPASTPARWVLADVRLGPVTLTPAVDVLVAEEDDRVVVRGRPVDGHTRSWLDIDVRVGEADGATALQAAWNVGVEMRGPQVMATTLHSLVVASARRSARRVCDRLRHRFGAPAP